MTTSTTYGQRLRDARSARSLQQKDAADLLGISPQHLSDIERNQRAPSVGLAARIVQHFNVLTDDELIREQLRTRTAALIELMWACVNRGIYPIPAFDQARQALGYRRGDDLVSCIFADGRTTPDEPGALRMAERMLAEGVAV